MEQRRILLVDDSVDAQRLFSIFLKKTGAEVILAANGREGVNAVEAATQDGRPFDLILMDMQMPVMDGITATQLLREKGIDTPIVALTGNDLQEARYISSAAGFTDFLTKPIQRDALLSAVAKIIDTKPNQSR